MIDRIARIICPEAFDRNAFRRIVKESNDGHTAGIDVAASMQAARDAARAKAQDVLALIRVPTVAMEEAGVRHSFRCPGPLIHTPTKHMRRQYQAMIDAASVRKISGLSVFCDFAGHPEPLPNVQSMAMDGDDLIVATDQGPYRIGTDGSFEKVDDKEMTPTSIQSAAAKVLHNPATSKRAKMAAGKGMTQR